MSRSKECRHCGEPVIVCPEDRTRFVCMNGCDTDPSTQIDEAEYIYGDEFYEAAE